MITSISLSNWRSHESTRIEFGKGTNLLVGIMGSGKSSVMDALCFAFYGDFPALQHGKAVLKDVLRFGAKEAEVKLEFAVGEDSYEVLRTVTHKSSDARLSKNGKLLEKSPKAVTRALEGILKVDYDLFTRAVYSVQNRMDYLLTLDPGNRKKEIDRLLGLDRFEKARANATTLSNRLKEMREALAKGYSPERTSELEKRKKSLAESAKLLSEQMASLSSSLSSLKQQLSEKESAYSQLSKLRQEHKRLGDEKERATALISRLRHELAKTPADFLEKKSLDEKKEALAKLQKEAEAMRLKLRKLSEDANSLSSQLGMLESREKAEQARLERVKALEKELAATLEGETLKALGHSQSECRKKIIELRGDAGVLESGMAELKDSLSSLKDGMGKCPVCDSSLGEEKTRELRHSKKHSLEQGEKKLAHLKAELSSLEKKESELEKRMKRAESLSASLSELSKSAAPPNLESEIKKQKSLLSEKAEERKELEKGASASEASLSLLKEEIFSREQALSKKSELTSLDASLSKLEHSLSQVKFDEKTFEEARGELEQLRLSHAKGEGELSSKKRELTYVSESSREADSELSRLGELKLDAEYYSQREEEIVVFKNCISETQAAIRSELIEAINTAMAEIWPIVYPYPDYREIRLSADAKDYSFELRREGDEEWHPLDAVASGGERACLCLAMRISFAMVLTPNLSWLILDEPTHNLDEEAVKLLAETLEQKIPEIVEQTFIITHDASLADSEFAAVYRFSRNKAGAEASKVEKL